MKEATRARARIARVLARARARSLGRATHAVVAILACLAAGCGSPEGDEPETLVSQALAQWRPLEPDADGSSSAPRAPAAAPVGGSASSHDYTLFEADPVRPIAVLERSGTIAVANTVDDALELFRPTHGSVEWCGAVPVGRQPVAVAVVKESRSHAELWVVNHISDSVSVVALDLDNCRAEVVRTLLVADEPRDIVVARDAANQPRVFVAVAHRGQHHPSEGARLGADLVTPPNEKEERGLGDVLVFDPALPDAPPHVVNLFADKPRALAVADGVVYAASYMSGNRTAVLPEKTVTQRGLRAVNAVLARDAAGAPIERGDELQLVPGAEGQPFEGGTPAVAGHGRCVADPRDGADGFSLLRLCVETDAENRLERVVVQRAGNVHPSCQCTSGDGTLQPTNGVIVKFFDDPLECGAAWSTFPDASQGCWLDAAPGGVRTPARGADRVAPAMAWNDEVKFSLPDQDVFAIGVDDLEVSRSFAHVGTVLFGLAAQPGSGKLFVTNTEAQNLTRFEGHGLSSSTSVIGHLHESRITVIDPSAASTTAAVQPVHLNTHIDYGRCCEKDALENAKSFAFPTAGVFSEDGERYFFSALGSDKIGILSASAVAPGFDQDVARAADDLREIFLGDDVEQPSGPVGLALDAHRDRLYVKTHFDDGLVVIDTRRERITGRVRLHSPEPPSVTRGRSLLYNARLTSSHGDSACASCHVFGDFDGLAWDLGNPDGASVTNPGPFSLPGMTIADFRSNKGPMVTQTLRGLANHGPLHWRGDRTRRFQDSPGEQPDVGAFDEANSFGEFDVAITGLNGNDVMLDPSTFAEFAEFTLQLSLPPNPIRRLDGTLTDDEAAGRALFFGCSSMDDAQFEGRRCTALDGNEVDVDRATHDCLCARNPVVGGLRLLPQVRGMAGLLHDLLAGDLRARLEGLASDTSALPADARASVAAAAAEFAAGNSQLLQADLAPEVGSLLSPSLAGALSRLSGGLLVVLEASREHATSTRDEVAAAWFEAIPDAALPPELPRTPEGMAQIFQLLAQIPPVSELARADELARGTSAFRDVSSGCDLEQAPACQLRVTDILLTCQGCHRLDPDGNAEFGVSRPGFFGTNGVYSFDQESQVLKIPHLRNQYQKAGMFGQAPNPDFLPESVLGARRGGFIASDNEFMGPQVRGVGFFHDGVVDTLHRFHGAKGFASQAGNEDGFDARFPRASERAACVQTFRRAPMDLFVQAAADELPLLGLCLESGPLPQSCFMDPSTDACKEALARAEADGFEGLSDTFADRVLPLCFQLGSMAEAGSPLGVCAPAGLRERTQLESFILAFDTNLKPMVGQQLTRTTRDEASGRLTALLEAAARGDCDLSVQQEGRGFLLTRPDAANPERSRIEDRRGRVLSLGDLPERATTFTCHPPAPDQAEARRSAFDRATRRH